VTSPSSSKSSFALTKRSLTSSVVMTSTISAGSKPSFAHRT
jgi:hypothetical protein